MAKLSKAATGAPLKTSMPKTTTRRFSRMCVISDRCCCALLDTAIQTRATPSRIRPSRKR
jgi:hypothetical protein